MTIDGKPRKVVALDAKAGEVKWVYSMNEPQSAIRPTTKQGQQ